jgi:hypothetical protein
VKKIHISLIKVLPGLPLMGDLREGRRSILAPRIFFKNFVLGVSDFNTNFRVFPA